MTAEVTVSAAGKYLKQERLEYYAVFKGNSFIFRIAVQKNLTIIFYDVVVLAKFCCFVNMFFMKILKKT